MDKAKLKKRKQREVKRKADQLKKQKQEFVSTHEVASCGCDEFYREHFEVLQNQVRFFKAQAKRLEEILAHNNTTGEALNSDNWPKTIKEYVQELQSMGQ